MNQNSATLAMNRGLLSQLALARIDIARYRMAAEVMTNFIARKLGSMMLRPGWAYIGNTQGNAYSKTIPFVFSATDMARVEVTASTLRVWINDALVTRPAVTAAVTNGNFTSNLSGWTDSDESGAASTWVVGGYASFVGTGISNAILDQQVTVNEIGVEHALRIIIKRGPVVLRVGSTQGDDNYITETTLGTGTHSLTLTPSGAFWIRLMNNRSCASLVDSVNIEAAGILTLPSPWVTGDLRNLRSAPSADVTEVAYPGYQQRRIERRSLRSWSIVIYEPEKGPFRVANTTPITIAPSALSGDVTLTSSKALFKTGHVGALYRLTSVGQVVNALLTASDTYTNPIRVSGVGAQRIFTIQIIGPFSGFETLQYSVAAPGAWVDATTFDHSASYNDGLDNQVLYYRIGFKPGDYVSGTANTSLIYSSGSITGIARVTGFTDSMHVSAAVLTPLGGTDATSNWSEGAWSDYRGWPRANTFHEGRLWWFGSKLYGSVSDDYENFDDTTIGESGPLIRSIGEGPIDNIYWGTSVQRLLIGTASAEQSVRSSSLDSPLTPTDFVIRPASTLGVANVCAVRLDKTVLYVDVSGARLFQLQADVYGLDYKSIELTELVPDLNQIGIVHLAVQRRPDTRVHCIRADGTAGLLVFDEAENVNCWQEITTAGIIEDTSVLPGTVEDQVYYTVNRNGARLHEKWALESECTGLPVAKHADAHVNFVGTETTTITGLGVHEGREVVVWGWNTVHPFIDGAGNTVGRDLGPQTVSGGQITVAEPITNACVGLGATGQWKSMQQAFAAAMGTPLNQAKRIDKLGIILRNTQALGISMGPDFDHLDDLPYEDFPRLASDDTQADTSAMLTYYNKQMTAFNGEWDTDARVCLQGTFPKPASVLAFTVSMSTSG